MSSTVWELPNLQELDLSSNEFSRLDFGLMRTPRLKSLNVSFSEDPVELSDLPSSIAVLEADYCTSLETIEDVSKCKSLWKVLLHGTKKVGPLVGNMLIDSILKGNAIEDHLISIGLSYLPEGIGIVGRLFTGKTYTMRLPHDWCNDFVVTCDMALEIDIIMKQQEVDGDSRSELQEYHETSEESEEASEESDEAMEESEDALEESDEATEESDEASKSEDYEELTYVGYVPFNSLRHNACLNSTYNVIAISYRQSVDDFDTINRVGVALVPRKSKDDPVKITKLTTDRSEFWDEGDDYRQVFTIDHDSKSSIKILWRPDAYDISSS